ncbi:protein kinase [Streptomyces sp. NPDC048590]|uniref:protein kinase domain-containing protein n=1 Tax=Streptomyces sp. NPDC048590 TaxID=3365574 RepID=UPI0037121886
MWGAGVEDLRDSDPRAVGPFRLLRRLGGGGMGQVFLGRSRGGLLVAVKLVRPELAGDAGFRRRFAREVRAAKEVGGFYTAQVVDADTSADLPWLATAYIAGPSLQQAVSLHGALPEPAVIRLAAGLAEGLAAVHASGMVHRDLKPGNVLLAADGPRLIDFGIARAAEDTQLTGTGMAIGTPGFMAPEQVVGNAAGPESDVFALGAVLAYAATGRLPFGAGPPHSVNYRVVHEPPDLSGAPSALASLAADCLAKEGSRRPDLGRFLDRVPALDAWEESWLPPSMTTMSEEPGATGPQTTGAFFDGTDPVPPGAGTWGSRRMARERRERDEAGERRRERASRLLAHTEAVCSRITGVRERAQALAHVAAAAGPVNDHRVGFLAVEAHRCAATAPDPVAHAQALAAISAEFATTDPDRSLTAGRRAEALAMGLRGRKQFDARQEALAAAAEALAPAEPEEAEALARGIEDPYDRDSALQEVAEQMAAADPERAERIVKEIGRARSWSSLDWSLRRIASATAVTDLVSAERLIREVAERMDHDTVDGLRYSVAVTAALSNPFQAERIARSIEDATSRDFALSAVVHELAPSDPEHALRIAQNTPDGDTEFARSALLRHIAEDDPQRAERRALETPGAEARASALFEVFLLVREEHPRLAWRVARAIPQDQHWERLCVLLTIAEDLGEEGDTTQAGRFIREAEGMASQISDPEDREHAMARIAKSLVGIEPDRACVMASGLPTPNKRADALLCLALALKESRPSQAEELFADSLRSALAVIGPTDRFFILRYGITASVMQAPEWASSLALEAAAGRPGHNALSTLADLLADHVPERAAGLAVDAVHAARAKSGGDDYNTYAESALVTLARINPVHAADLALSHRPPTEADDLLLSLVKGMVVAMQRAVDDLP